MSCATPRVRLTALGFEIFSNGKSSIVVTGRLAWAMLELQRAGNEGVSRMDHASTSLPCYIHTLKHVHGINILTRLEKYSGKLSGYHAWYFLKADLSVTLLKPDKTKPATAATVRASNPNHTATGEVL